MTNANPNSGSKKARRSKSPGGYNGHRFIEYSLTASDKEILRTEYSESDFGYDLVEDLVGQGFKFSLSYSDAMGCFTATLSDRREDSQFNACSLSGRGATAAMARVSLLYRHFVVAQEDWRVLDKGGDKQVSDYD